MAEAGISPSFFWIPPILLVATEGKEISFYPLIDPVYALAFVISRPNSLPPAAARELQFVPVMLPLGWWCPAFCIKPGFPWWYDCWLEPGWAIPLPLTARAFEEEQGWFDESVLLVKRFVIKLLRGSPIIFFLELFSLFAGCPPSTPVKFCEV